MKSRSPFLVASLALLGLFACASSVPAPIPAPVPSPESPPGYVIHPAPKPPKYISADLFEEFKRKIVHPPKPGSRAQKSDEAELFKLQKERTAADCERAADEVKIDLESFMGESKPILSEAELRELRVAFRQFLNDADYYVQKLKVAFPRDRPFVYLKGIEPCIAKEVTKSYPSGHAAISRLYARILGELIPQEKRRFLELADSFGRDRVLGGVHHPTDILAGKQLGDLVYSKLRKSPEYRKWVKEFFTPKR